MLQRGRVMIYAPQTVLSRFNLFLQYLWMI